MKGDCDDYIGRDLFRRYRRAETPPGKINTLLSDLLEKEEEIAEYKDRLKELETAFYYNLDLISERDFEISVLEKRLRSETEEQKALIRERDELENLVKVIDEKKNRKIQQLETKLTLKEDEIREIQRDHMNNVNALKRKIDDLRAQQDKKLNKLSNRYELQKKELLKNYREEMEDKEKYYLLEIDKLTGKLEQARREKEALARFEQECRDLKFHLEDVERLFLEKENYYLEKIKKLTKPGMRQINREIQCGFVNQLQGIDRNVQAEPDKTAAECQTRLTELEEQYRKKINFLEEQNEVLKCVIKEMKKSKSEPKVEGKASGCECTAVEMVEKVNKKFQGEINNLKEILEEERKERKEEEAAIQSLETSVTCLKNKLLMGLQEKFQQFSEGGNSNCAYSHGIQNEMLEKKLCKRIDILMTTAREEREKLLEKLEEVKKECVEKIETYLTPKQEIRGENLLEKIRLEMQELEKKIESDVNYKFRNNLNKNYDKNKQSVESSDTKNLSHRIELYPLLLSDDVKGTWELYSRDNLTSDKSLKPQMQRTKSGEQKEYTKMRKDLDVR